MYKELLYQDMLFMKDKPEHREKLDRVVKIIVNTTKFQRDITEDEAEVIMKFLHNIH